MQIVLSASRRTDIPAFYMKWFMKGIEQGRFSVRHPYTGAFRTMAAGADRVHSIVFWSKDFGPFLNEGCGERLAGAGYGLFFNFTVNSRNDLLEPRVPPLARRLAQIDALARRFGPESIQWRFDPVCFYQTGEGAVCDNLGDLPRIAAAAAQAGVTRCVTSFLDLYGKVRRRAAKIPGFSFVDPPLAEKVAVLQKMTRLLADSRIRLFVCCEKEVLDAAPPDIAAASAACIPGEALMRLYSGRVSLRRDAGQRRAKGCGCRASVDIGSYTDQPCRHGCLFCYANPVSGPAPPGGGRPAARGHRT